MGCGLVVIADVDTETWSLLFCILRAFEIRERVREWGSHYLVSLTCFGTTLHVFEVYPVVYRAVLVEFRIACLFNTLSAGGIKHLLAEPTGKKPGPDTVSWT